MANRTVKDAVSVHGTNPQYLVEKIIRSRIYESKYWKEECFAVTAELIVDKAMELRYCGGVFGGNIKPTPFMCLLLKMLQIQPEKDIIIEFLRQEDFKYLRALAAIYLRLTATALDIYKYLEPLYNDYRKVRFQTRDGTFVLSTVDQFVDELLVEERACDIILPRLQKRHVLEESSDLEPRVSLLDDDNEDDEEEEEDEEEEGMEGDVAKEMEKIAASRRQQMQRETKDEASSRRDDERGGDRGDRGGRAGRRGGESSPPARGERRRGASRERADERSKRGVGGGEEQRHHRDRDERSRHERERDHHQQRDRERERYERERERERYEREQRHYREHRDERHRDYRDERRRARSRSPSDRHRSDYYARR